MEESKSEIVRFKLDADSSQLKRMTEELDDAPTYSVRFDTSRRVMSVDAARKRSLSSDSAGTKDELLARGLAGKLSIPAPDGSESKTRYERRRVLGEGGAGVVYEMVDHNIGREVAVKVLKDAPSEDDRELFIQEGMLAAKLEHPNIIPIYDMDADSDDRVYLTMKKVKGKNLKTVADGVASLSLDEAVLVFLKVCDALAYAHSQGSIHQDVKPENVMLGNYGEVFVIDWGTASYSGGEMELSPVYMSPQQAHGSKATVVDDIYCLGATMFHVLLKRVPTRALSIEELWSRKRAGEIDLPTAREKRYIPKPLLAIMLKALHADPAQRYRSVQELANDLKAYQAGFPTSAEGAGAMVQFAMFLKRRHREVLAAAALVAIFGMIGVTYFANVHRARTAQAKSEAERARAEAARIKADADKVSAELAARDALDEKKRLEQEKEDTWNELVTQDFRKDGEIDPRLGIQEDEVVDGGVDVHFRSLRTSIRINEEIESEPKLEIVFSCERIPSLQIHFEVEGQGQTFRRAFNVKDYVTFLNFTGIFGTLFHSPKSSIGVLHYDKPNTLTAWRKKNVWYLDINRQRFIEYYDQNISLRRCTTKINISRHVPYADLKIHSIKTWNRHSADYIPVLEQGRLLLRLGRKKEAREWFQVQSRQRHKKELADEAIYLAAAIDAGQGLEQRLQELLAIANDAENEFSYRALHDYILLKVKTDQWREVIDPLARITREKPQLNTFNNVWGALYRHIWYLPEAERMAILSRIMKHPPNTITLGRLKLRDLSFLRTAGEFSGLYLGGSPVTDLSPLRGRKLRYLDISRSRVTDLSPLAGMELRELQATASKIPDLSPLAGASLNMLVLKRCSLVDASTLSKTKVVKLILDGTKVTNRHGLSGTDAKLVRLIKCELESLDFMSKMRPVSVHAGLNKIRNADGLQRQNLTVLDLTFNQIEDISALKSCTIRSMLNLSGNPVADLSPLKGKATRYLDISCTKIRDLSVIRTLDSLIGLQIQGPERFYFGKELGFEAAKPDLSTLGEVSLKELSLPGNGITDITPFKACRLYHEVDLSNNPISDITPLIGKDIVVLGLRNTLVTDLRLPAKMTKLRTLDMDCDPERKGPLTNLSGLEGTQLHTLKAANHRIKDISGLRGNRSLRFLKLSGNPVSDLTPLHGVPLEHLGLANTKVGSLAFVKHLPKLRTLQVQGSAGSPGRISDISELSGMTIKWANLSYNQITDLRPLKGTTIHHSLMVAGNPITDISPLIGSRVKSLDISHTKVTDFSALRKMKWLKRVWIVGLRPSPEQMKILEEIKAEVHTKRP